MTHWEQGCDEIEVKLAAALQRATAAEAECEDLRKQLHRFQTGQEIESDYLCKSDLELLGANERIALEGALRNAKRLLECECAIASCPRLALDVIVAALEPKP